MTRLSLLVLALIYLSSCQPSTEEDPQALEKEIDQIVNQLSPSLQIKGEEVPVYTLEERMEYHQVPGLSITVVRGGELRWARGFGMANTELETTVDEQTLFQAGSISKPLAALGALKLVEDGKLSLDEDINNYLTSWQVPASPFLEEKKVTLRGLLSHQAGMTVHGFPGYTQQDTFPSDIEVLDGEGNTAPIRVDTFPGSLWRYSGGGYTVMERAVEDQSGQDFSDYLAEAVLEPMGMSRSTYTQPLREDWHENASAAYNSAGEIAEGYWNNYPEQAAAGLWTTPTDLAKYCIEMMEAHRGESSKVISQEMVKAMLTEQPLGWGLGPSLNVSGDSIQFGHGGKNRGFTNNMVAFDYLQDAIIVMTSADRGSPLIQEIQRAAAQVYGWDLSSPQIIEVVDMSTEAKEARVGSYLIRSMDYQIEVVLEDGTLFVIDPNEDDRRYKLAALDDTEMIDLFSGGRFTFKTEGGEVKGMVAFGEHRLEKIE